MRTDFTSHEDILPKLILFQPSDNPPILQPVIAVADFPDEHGMIMLTEAVDMLDGSTSNLVPFDRCHDYDEWLMQQVNTLVSQAMDSMAVASKLIELRGKPAFPVEITINSDPSLMH